MIIPCPKCLWQDPILNFDSVVNGETQHDITALVYKMRCKCGYHGDVTMPISFKQTGQAR